MANNGNLIPFDKLSKDKAREIRAKGGKARAENIRQRKILRECINDILQERATDKSNLTKLEVIALRVIERLYKYPSVTDLKKLMEVLGEYPANISVQTDNESITADSFLNIKLEDNPEKKK